MFIGLLTASVLRVDELVASCPFENSGYLVLLFTFLVECIVDAIRHFWVPFLGTTLV